MQRAIRQGLQGCHVLSLRPVGAHTGLRAAVARAGGRLVAVSPWRLETRDDADTRKRLRDALAAPLVVFTSPAAVRAAASLQPLRARRGQHWCAVGAGTARALRRAGIEAVLSPARMDSEGLLALPVLRDVRKLRVGLATAPDGRDRIAAVLARRGARLVRADVYARIAIAPSPTALTRLRAIPRGAWLALSSGQALQLALSTWPAEAVVALRRARVAAASERLAALARDAGFARVRVAASARPRDLVAAMLPRR